MQNLFCKPLYVIIKVKILVCDGIFTPYFNVKCVFLGKTRAYLCRGTKILFLSILML